MLHSQGHPVDVMLRVLVLFAQEVSFLTLKAMAVSSQPGTMKIEAGGG